MKRPPHFLQCNVLKRLKLIRLESLGSILEWLSLQILLLNEKL